MSEFRFTHSTHRKSAPYWRRLLLIAGLLFGYFLGYAQTTVTGTITDESASPLVGVTVVVKGTQVGGITDVDGRYRVNVPAGQNTLVFSYTGYASQEVNIDGRATVDVRMGESVSALNASPI